VISPIGDILSKLQDKHNISADLTPQERRKEEAESLNKVAGHLNEQDDYNCELCKNKGFIVRVDEKGCVVSRFCKCKKIRATLKRARKSGLGDIITDYTFDKFVDTDDWQKLIKSMAKAFCEDESAKWFYVGGQVGCGKTHICTAIAAHYIKAGQDVKYMVWSEEAKKLKAIVNDPMYQSEIAVYKDADVLYIDDFLKVKAGENPTVADINLAFEIINHRLISRNKITIISSEKLLDELMEYDEATMSRIYQKTGDYKFNIGKDRTKNYRLREV